MPGSTSTRLTKRSTVSVTKLLVSLSLLTALAPAAQAQIVTSLDWTDRTRITSYEDEQRQLERDLLAVEEREEFPAFIESKDYLISAINEDSANNLEFEVVHDGISHEVRLGFDRGNGPADAIDVTANLWLAEGTRQAIADPDWRPASLVFDAQAGAKARDSNHMTAWEQQRDALEAAMPVGNTIDVYKAAIDAAGYRISAASESLPTHADYEIVKGNESLEVQIERDVTTGRAISVEVEANIWKAAETAEALRGQ